MQTACAAVVSYHSWRASVSYADDVVSYIDDVVSYIVEVASYIDDVS